MERGDPNVKTFHPNRASNIHLNNVSYSPKVFSPEKIYEIYRNGELSAEVVEDLSFFNDKFRIDIPAVVINLVNRREED